MSVTGSGPVPLGTGGVRPAPVSRTRGVLDRAHLRGLWIRRALGFGIALIGMLWIGAEYVDTSWCWLLWIGVGLLAGAVVGRGRDVWLVVAAGFAFFPVAAWRGVPVVETSPPEAWYVVTILGALLVASGFVLGSLVWALPRLSDAMPASTGGRPAGTWLVLAAVASAVLVIAGWVLYAGMVGGAYLTRPDASAKWLGCDTPRSRFSAAYEAINYDPADDARLLAADPDAYRSCSSRGSLAGTEVVSKDGTGIAGWYIPAAAGTGPTGPTFVVAPGWKSNKSEILKYVPALHEAYNLVLVDLRNGGRSQGDETTWGYHERDDVHAMIDWLVRTKHPTWIGATGNSMGAATVLAEAVDDPRVQALILDSMHASIVTSFGDGIEFESHLPGYPTTYAAVAAASITTGHDLQSVDPVRTITQLGDRPVLLLHGAADPLDRPEHSAELNLAAATAAGVPVELHYCPGAGHGKVVDTCPAQWAAWAKAFLDRIVPTTAR